MLSRAIAGWGRLLGLGGSSATDEERRLWGRIPCDLETRIQPAAGPEAPAEPARARNISRGGINLAAGRPFELGALLSVALPVDGGTEMLACVVRCERDEGGWALGCTFAAQLSDEDLQSFGARREKAVPPDQRAWVRFPCQATATYQAVRAAEVAGSRAAAVLDISASGVALQAAEPLHVGELLSLELSRDGEVRLATLASVVRTATAPDGARVVGCNFISELSEEQVSGLL